MTSLSLRLGLALLRIQYLIGQSAVNFRYMQNNINFLDLSKPFPSIIIEVLEQSKAQVIIILVVIARVVW